VIKQKTYRNPAYLKWVKTLPCYVCHMPADDPHHATGLKLGGMGIRSPDWTCLPLCRICHTDYHNGNLAIEQWEAIAKTLGKALEESIL